jgi:Flp pilus assembly protein TadG
MIRLRSAAGERGRRQGRGRRAAAAVEFAVVGLVFFPLVLGIIEVGRGLMIIHVLTAAATHGCRTAIVEGNGKDQVDAAVSSVLTGAGITNVTPTVRVNNAPGDPATAQAGDEITVIVSVPVSQVTWVPGGHFLSGNLSAQYTLTKE